MKYFPLLLLCIGNLCLAQINPKVYSFDHLLEYEYREEINSKPTTVYFLTNSKINDYHVRAEKRKEIGDSIYVKFMDYSSHTTSFFDLAKEDFFAEDFLLNRKIVNNVKISYPFYMKQYHIEPQKDSVVDDLEFYGYVLKLENEKRERRRKLCRFHYTLEENTAYHIAPVLSAVAYEVWKTNKSLPKGIARKMYDTNHFQNDHHFYELKNISRIDKQLQIIGD